MNFNQPLRGARLRTEVCLVSADDSYVRKDLYRLQNVQNGLVMHSGELHKHSIRNTSYSVNHFKRKVKVGQPLSLVFTKQV